MPKGTETEKTIGFFVTFLSLVAFYWRGGGFLDPPMIALLNLQEIPYNKLAIFL